jgi:hypothetical protein
VAPDRFPRLLRCGRRHAGGGPVLVALVGFSPSLAVTIAVSVGYSKFAANTGRVCFVTTRRLRPGSRLIRKNEPDGGRDGTAGLFPYE